MNDRRPWILAVLSALALAAAPTPAEEPRPMHKNAEKLWVAHGNATNAFLINDLDSAADHLKVVASHVRRMGGEDVEAYTQPVVSYSDAFQATLLHLLGIDHERLTFKYQGRRFRLTDVHGHVVKDILT